jgi:DNA/RNA-binding domain of Phe-tRNA-synthetase-like protein
MKITIEKGVRDKFTGLNVGIVLARNINNKGRSRELDRLLDEVEKLIQLDFVPTALAKHPLLSPWRSAYSDFGAKPSKYNSSVEALMRRILKGEKIPKINKLVDLYNYLSLKHIIPMGADDLGKVEGDIKLTIAKGSEKFVPLGEKKAENPEAGEVIYRDDVRVLCRRWNWRDSDETKITESTKNAVIYVEGLPPVTRQKLADVCREVIDLIKTFCSGEADYYILTHKDPEIKFEV